MALTEVQKAENWAAAIDRVETAERSLSTARTNLDNAKIDLERKKAELHDLVGPNMPVRVISTNDKAAVLIEGQFSGGAMCVTVRKVPFLKSPG